MQFPHWVRKASLSFAVSKVNSMDHIWVNANKYRMDQHHSAEKSVGKWSRSEERYFFEHLRFASSNSRERCAGDIAHILGNKSVEQVNKYYNNIVRKLMGYAPAGSNFRQYEVSNIHRSMVFYWDTVLVRYLSPPAGLLEDRTESQNTLLPFMQLPSREQRNARANAGAREKGKVRTIE